MRRFGGIGIGCIGLGNWEPSLNVELRRGKLNKLWQHRHNLKMLHCGVANLQTQSLLMDKKL
jgi:hypothetical protein